MTSNDIIGKYQIESKRSYDTLELKKDGTYEYHSLGDSCWTWSNFTGTWEIKSDLLILNHEYSIEEDCAKYFEKIEIPSKDFVTFVVLSINGEPIPNFEVKYSSINNKSQIKKTDENGIIIFDKYEIIYDKNDSVNIYIKFKTNELDTSVSNSVSRNSDRINLKINFQPKTIFKKKKYKFSYINKTLKSIEFEYVDETSTYKKL